MPAILLLIAAMAVVNMEGVVAGVVPADCKLDLIFLDDGSSSVCEDNPQCSNWKHNLGFIKNIIRHLTIGPDQTKVAYLKYGDYADLRWGFNGYTDKKSLLNAIDGETIPGGEIYSTSSFSVLTGVYNEEDGDRPGVPNVAIMIVNGANHTDQEAVDSSNFFKEFAHSRLLVVCLNTTSSKCYETVAKPMSSQPQEEGVTYFMSPDYSSIGSVFNSLLEHICDPNIDGDGA